MGKAKTAGAAEYLQMVQGRNGGRGHQVLQGQSSSGLEVGEEGAGRGVKFKETVLGNTGKEFLLCYSESINLWPSRTPRILA